MYPLSLSSISSLGPKEGGKDNCKQWTIQLGQQWFHYKWMKWKVHLYCCVVKSATSRKASVHAWLDNRSFILDLKMWLEGLGVQQFVFLEGGRFPPCCRWLYRSYNTGLLKAQCNKNIFLPVWYFFNSVFSGAAVPHQHYFPRLWSEVQNAEPQEANLSLVPRHCSPQILYKCGGLNIARHWR
jgi:hypothetical protein